MHKIVENYILYDPIGTGQIGKVFRAKNTKTNENVAIKAIPLDKLRETPKMEEFIANEIKTLNKVRSPHILKFIEMLKTSNNMYLVYEYCDSGTLEDVLQKRHHLSEVESLRVFQQLLSAFRVTTKENILHRGLKCSNIYIHSGIVKIADFGLCKKMSGPQELTFTMVGSPIYMAPEVLKGYPYNLKADIWSLGVVLYEMLYGVCPYEEKTLPALISQVDTKPLVFHTEINNISQNTENLLRKMLNNDHKARIEWNELLEYPLNIETLGQGSLDITKGFLKLDADVSNKSSDQKQLKYQRNEKILRTLMKERNKITFISNVLHSMLEFNTSQKTPIAAFLALKRVTQLLETLKRDVSSESTTPKYKAMEGWNDFLSSEEFMAFSRYLNEELDETSAFLSMFKQEMNTLTTGNPNSTDLNDSTFQKEKLNNTVDMKFLHNILLACAEDVRNAGLEKLKQGDELEALKLFLHANEILDVDNVEEFFDKTLDSSELNLNEQTYFAHIKKITKEKIQEVIISKLSLAKARVIH